MNAPGPGVVDHADLFHTGIVVDDLASAMEELGAILGVAWNTGGAEVRLTDAAGVRTVRTAYALSTAGPHHVELVQSIIQSAKGSDHVLTSDEVHGLIARWKSARNATA